MGDMSIVSDKETVREHARLGGFPANSISEVMAIVTPQPPNELTRPRYPIQLTTFLQQIKPG